MLLFIIYGAWTLGTTGVIGLKIIYLVLVRESKSIGEDFNVNNNDALTGLTGLNNVISIGEDLKINHNYALTSLTGLDNLTSIDGSLNIGYYDDYGSYGNPSLIDITGLENIDAGSITDLTISYNLSLSTCEVQSICDYLANPSGYVSIGGNATGCNSQEEVEDACGFLCLPEGITFTSQEEIDNFQFNYPYCIEIEGDVEINGEDITNLVGINVLTFIGGDLWIDSCNILTGLSGLANLTFVGGDLWIEGCNILTGLSGLDDLTFVGGDLWIEGNNTLSNLIGLENVTSIGGNLIIEDNDILADLYGLQKLNQIGGDLFISGNNLLTTIAELNSVTAINGNLWITNNAAIYNLWGLNNIDPGSIEELKIVDNPLLSECDVHSICDYLVNPGGTVQINNNATGCNDQQEIEEACETHCLYNGFTFSDQNQIDNFQTNYPGCAQIEGDVKIGGNDITNLNGLNILTYIGGDLSIGYYAIGGINPSLNDISGLINLTSIGWWLYLGYCISC